MPVLRTVSLISLAAATIDSHEVVLFSARHYRQLLVHTPGRFPLRGIIGVVANSADEVHLAVDKGLQCVELRADLLLGNGLSESALLDLVKTGKQLGLGVLFTLRHPTHGGTFSGAESERVSLSLKAMSAGADLFDVELGTDAAALLPDDAPAFILSYHNFNGMPTTAELHSLTAQMESSGASAIKVVPTASTLSDALTMLKWLGERSADICRIGFAMGEEGACSRILTTALGGEVTYASFGAPVAPGQIAIDELISLYRAGGFDHQTRMIAVCGDGEDSIERSIALNESAARGNEVAIRFSANDRSLIEEHSPWLRVAEIVNA